MSTVLEKLRSDETEHAVMGLSSVPARIRRLATTSSVQEVQQALRSGIVEEENAREFIRQLLKDFRSGERFRFESALAGLAVAVRDYFDDWAEEYLERLAALELSELAYASAVARICLEMRQSVPFQETRIKVFEAAKQYETLDFTLTDTQWSNRAQLNIQRYEYAET